MSETKAKKRRYVTVTREVYVDVDMDLDDLVDDLEDDELDYLRGLIGVSAPERAALDEGVIGLAQAVSDMVWQVGLARVNRAPELAGYRLEDVR